MTPNDDQDFMIGLHKQKLANAVNRLRQAGHTVTEHGYCYLVDGKHRSSYQVMQMAQSGADNRQNVGNSS